MDWNQLHQWRNRERQKATYSRELIINNCFCTFCFLYDRICQHLLNPRVSLNRDATRKRLATQTKMYMPMQKTTYIPILTQSFPHDDYLFHWLLNQTRYYLQALKGCTIKYSSQSFSKMIISRLDQFLKFCKKNVEYQFYHSYLHTRFPTGSPADSPACFSSVRHHCFSAF